MFLCNEFFGCKSAIVGAFNQKKALVGAISVIVKPSRRFVWSSTYSSQSRRCSSVCPAGSSGGPSCRPRSWWTSCRRWWPRPRAAAPSCSAPSRRGENWKISQFYNVNRYESYESEGNHHHITLEIMIYARILFIFHCLWNFRICFTTSSFTLSEHIVCCIVSSQRAGFKTGAGCWSLYSIFIKKHCKMYSLEILFRFGIWWFWLPARVSHPVWDKKYKFLSIFNI